MTLHNGDCLEVMRGMPDNSVDLVLTDPPYGLRFMGKKWDYDVPGVEVWREALRVLKPGGHCLAFAGTRTQHRMAVNIEDAGFEIRDMLAWLYGSGFPKSHDISKAIDKAAGAEREVTGIIQKCGMATAAEKYLDNQKWSGLQRDLPATDLACEWQGYGTALKPACEPITMARKPLEGTVAANVAKYGTGGLNIDGCRVGSEKRHNPSCLNNKITAAKVMSIGRESIGRWPANVIHDGSDEVLALFPVTKSGLINPRTVTKPTVPGSSFPSGARSTDQSFGGDSGSAARFFYCAKASKKERDAGCDALPERRTAKLGGSDNDRCNLDPVSERFRTSPSRNHHPTVKPIALIEYLCKLASRPGAVVLDPFMGSGTTGIACRNLGREFIGIELDPEYFKIAEQRIQHTPAQMEIAT